VDYPRWKATLAEIVVHRSRTRRRGCGLGLASPWASIGGRAKPLRLAAADTNAVIVSGFEMPPRPA